MHRSRLAGFIIDCRTGDVDEAARFWSAALAMPTRATEGDRYVVLNAEARDLYVEVQRVEHDSRVHLDIESDDVPAEVARLERLGARRAEQTHSGTWVVMESPTGQRFCVVRAKRDLDGVAGVSAWP
jgi:hypothetical protein